MNGGKTDISDLDIERVMYWIDDGKMQKAVEIDSGGIIRLGNEKELYPKLAQGTNLNIIIAAKHKNSTEIETILSYRTFSLSGIRTECPAY